MKYRADKMVRLGVWVTGCLVAACLLAGSQPAPAAVLANYQFTGNSLASTVTQPNTTVGTFLSGPGINAGFSTTGNLGPSRTSKGKQTATSQNLDDYFSFTVTASSGYKLNLNGYTLTFDAQNVDRSGGSQTANWAVRTSVSGFGSANYSAGPMTETFIAMTPTTFTGAGYDGLTSFEVRIYMWDPNGSGEMRFDNVTLNGLVVAVPEPVHFALGIFGLGFAGLRVRRHYRARRRIA